jgi:phosphohistidine phosphatase SixA
MAHLTTLRSIRRPEDDLNSATDHVLQVPDLPEGSRRLYLCHQIPEDNDQPLDRHGHDLARQFSNLLCDVPMDVVASSDGTRCEQTADAIYNNQNGIRIIAPKLFSECKVLQGLDQILRDFASAKHVVMVGTQSTNEIVLRSLVAGETASGFMHILDVDTNNQWTLQQQLHENYVGDLEIWKKCWQ